jgi:hypothetical protein
MIYFSVYFFLLILKSPRSVPGFRLFPVPGGSVPVFRLGDFFRVLVIYFTELFRSAKFRILVIPTMK